MVWKVATGDLTVDGVTNTVQIPLQAQVVDGMILITGSSEIQFADYAVTAPSAPVVVSVEDRGILEFQIWLSRQAYSRSRLSRRVASQYPRQICAELRSRG